MSNTQRAVESKERPRLFVAYAMVIAAAMFVGFARNYYLRAWLGTRPITLRVHVHGLIMTAWVLLFLIQILLVARRRIDLHRKLGSVGGILAVLIVGLGVYTIAGSIARKHLDTSAGQYTLTFVAFDGLSLLLFGGLVLTALRLRSRPEIHKRLMLMAMIALLPPALGRLAAYFTRERIQITVLLIMCASVLLCVLIDSLRYRRLHPAFAWSGALVLAADLLTYFAQIAS